MKKNLFFAALAITALVSCSESDYLGDEKQVPVSSGDLRAISFGSGYKAVTRAEFEGKQAADSLRNNFVVMGVKSDGAPTTTCDTVFNHYNVNYGENTSHTTTSNSAGWEYVAQTKEGAYAAYGTSGDQSIKYWDYAKSQYDFIAWSKGGATAVYADGYTAGTNVQISAINPKTMNSAAYTIKGQAKDLAKVYIADLVTVYRDGANENDAAGKYGQEVDIKFRSLSAKARVGIYETVPGYSVKDVKFYSDAKTLDNDGKAHLYTTGTDVFNNEGTYTVYFPKTGKANKSDTDYNKAHLSFAAATNGTSTNMDFGTLDEDTYVNKYNAEKDEQVYIGRSSNEATYAGVDTNGEKHYTTVMPNETGALLNLKVRYTLLSTDGSKETITVDSATAKVPAEYAQWKSGYAYTYLFKISQNTNGFTNPAIVGKAGLYPITLDAVVVETTDSVQETITTVAEPSITTYAKGQVVTENNEYLPDSKIYVIVEDNGSVAPLTDKAKLYTVTLETGAAQTINEASVANVLVNGTPNSTSEPTSWTVKDKNGKDMVVTAASGLEISTNIAAADAPGGNQIDVNCAYFTPSQNNNDTVYVFQYIKTDPDPATSTYYTETEINTHNAALTGAVAADEDVPADYASKVGTAAAGAKLTGEEANKYNATLSGAWTEFTVKIAAGSTTPGVYGYKIIRIKR